jgi:8-oxo-dGTP diphosphatase
LTLFKLVRIVVDMKEKKTTDTNLRFAILAADVALFTVRDSNLLVRVAPVHRPPHFPNTHGLPGGLITPDETAEEAAARLIKSKGDITNPVYKEQLFTFSSIKRDPRGRVVAVAYLALVPWSELSPLETAGVGDATWLTIAEATNLAYDHDEMLGVALARLRSRARYTTIVRHLMPPEFTLSELETVYESLLKTDLDKRNFRKKILKLKVVEPLGRKKAHGAHRPAELYRFRGKKVEEVEVL